ncbi:MAG TPA: helix-turn-helix transcriptional regulator [Terriglobia bacterium]|nr:helix-turn-helix transcriptional regulator [Terriglobia bacterium]
MSTFGDWLRDERSRLGISRERLAADAGISYQTVQNAELGKPVLPMTERVLHQAIVNLTKKRIAGYPAAAPGSAAEKHAL